MKCISLFSKEPWDIFKRQSIEKMSTIEGWCSEEKAVHMMDLIKKYRCKTCVEIGVYSGKSLFPILKAIEYNEKGIVYAIDAWSAEQATKGFNVKNPNYVWWNEINYTKIYQKTLSIIEENQLSNQCIILKKSSQDALSAFKDESIDFIHFDGNHNEFLMLDDVLTYFPKVKNNGFIILNDPNWLSSKLALVFLLERTELISNFSREATYYVFRKNNLRLEAANELFNN